MTKEIAEKMKAGKELTYAEKEIVREFIREKKAEVIAIFKAKILAKKTEGGGK